MNMKVFNTCLLAGWFLLTLGGILLRPDVGLMIGGLALVVLTLAIALRFGIYEEQKAPPAGDKAPAA